MTNRPVIISACLLGLRTRYDGTDARSENAMTAVKDRAFIPVCPEQLGGLPTPRPCAWIEKGDGTGVLAATSAVMDANGVDVTNRFIAGAGAVLRIARMTGATEAFLKEKSPSCGVSLIKRGPEVIRGSGVTTTMLRDAGIAVRGF